MKEKLIEIQALLDLLGFSDMRSVKKFCIQNKIPLFNLGKKVYTLAAFIDLFVENELTLFVSQNYANPSEILEAVKHDDSLKLVKLMESKSEERNAVMPRKGKTKMGKAAKDLLTKLKTA